MLILKAASGLRNAPSRICLRGFIWVASLSIVLGARADSWVYDWTKRVDRDGAPAGIYTNTPIPIDEYSASYSITNDDGTKTFTLGAVSFVDCTLSGTTAAYNPAARSGTGGSYAGYKTIAAAISAQGNGNKTILVRSGTYSESNLRCATGIDDTHRWMLCGYKQERPVIDGGGTTANIFGSSTTPNKYVTLQRLQIQNSKSNGVRLGNYLQKYDGYYSEIDIYFHLVNYSLTPKQTQGDAAIYHMAADHGWIYHCTVERTCGHGYKMGDGADNGIIEWSVAKECGYWSTMVADMGITNWASQMGTHPTAIDVPNGETPSYPDLQEDNAIVRYNIACDSLFYGMQLRNVHNISCHHNEIYHTPHFSDVPGANSGAAGNPQLLLLGQAGPILDGRIYNNWIHDGADSAASGITVNTVPETGNPLYIYNNLITTNNGGSELYLYGYPAGGGGRRVYVYNNTLDHTSASTPAINDTGNNRWLSGELTFQNNIVRQQGNGAAVSFCSGNIHTYNLYHAPNGSVGVTTNATELIGNPNLMNGMPPEPNLGSPARGKGVGLNGLFTTDLQGNPRGAHWDIGAVQYFIPPPRLRKQ